MKKVYILLPSFISYIIITFAALMLPGYGNNSGGIILYGYPLKFLYVDNETILTLKDTIIEKIAINPLILLINVLILVVIINILIWIYKKIRARLKKPDPTKIQTVAKV